MGNEYIWGHQEALDLKGDVKILKSDVIDLQKKDIAFQKDIESLVKTMANLTSWLKWLVILIAGGFLTGLISLFWTFIESKIFN